MRDEYDLSDAIRHNPYLEKIKNGYSVVVHYNKKDNSEQNDGVTVKASPVVAEKASTYSQV